MSNKIALVTGANKGIGLEIARQLGQKGFEVIMAGRDQQRIESAAQSLQKQELTVRPLVMDVGDRTSILAAVETVKATTPQIDVLINNAGVLLDRDQSLLQLPAETLEITMQTNAFGPLYVVQTFLPLLRRGSRIINVSSGGGQILNGVSTWAPAYCMSKTLLNALTMQLAIALSSQGIVVNALCPGWVRTDMGTSAATRSVEQGADTAVWLAMDAPASATGRFFRDRAEISW